MTTMSVMNKLEWHEENNVPVFVSVQLIPKVLHRQRWAEHHHWFVVSTNQSSSGVAM